MTILTTIKETVDTLFKREWTVTEKVLVAANCLLIGTMIGMLLAPRKGNFALGSYNKNYSCPDIDEEGWIDEED